MTSLHDHASLQRAVHEALRWIDGYDTHPVGATADAATLAARLPQAFAADGREADAVIAELIALVDGGLHASSGGRFFAWVMGGAVPSALAADWLTSAWDQNAALHATAPAAAMIEELAGNWMLELLDLPRAASFAFTTGCQLAHFTALAAARHALLARRGVDVERDGLAAAPQIRVLTSAQRHASIDRAVRFLGIGERHLESLDTDHLGRVTAATLGAALRRSAGPTVVVLDAADLNIAAFDPFDELIPLARDAGAWVHIDGAFGLFARASATHRAKTAGLDLADSWATDAHKWLNVPFDCGLSVVRDREAHRAAMTVSASYIAVDDGVRHQIDWNPEWSRRARGFTVFAALRELGRSGVAAMIDRCCAHAQALVHRIGALPGAEVVWVPQLNQGLLRFRDPRPDATAADHDAFTDGVIAGINATGEAFFSGTTWEGFRAMRVSVVNWRTSDEDVSRTVAAVARVLHTMRRTMH